MTTFGDMLFQMGGMPVLAGVPFGPKAKCYFVDPTHGLDTNDGLSLEAPLATVTAAEEKCVANRHDTVFVLAASNTAANTTTYLSQTLTWDKDLTHLIGIGAPSMFSQRARIGQLSTAAGVSPLINITASGCVFKNFSVFQGVDDATSLIAVQVTGERNYFQNVHFAGGGHAAMAIDNGCSLKLNGGSENLFDGCVIGVDTISAGTGYMCLVFDTDAARNTFRGCQFRLFAGNEGAGFVEIADAQGIARVNIFDNCIFTNDSLTDLVSGFVAPAGMGVQRRILLKDCMTYGLAKLDANDRSVFYGNMGAVTGSDKSGEAVELIT